MGSRTIIKCRMDLCFQTILLFLIAAAVTWIPNTVTAFSAPSKPNNNKNNNNIVSKNGIERRKAVEYMTALISGGLGILSSEIIPQKVAAAEVGDDMVATTTTMLDTETVTATTTAATAAEVVEDTTNMMNFATYNIIPDASASLSPKLVEVNSKEFLETLATSKNGSSGGSIWLGEHHNAEKDHIFQANFIRFAHEERKKRGITAPMAIGLEQVQSQFQPVLDDYVDGKIDLSELKEKVEWNKRWMWSFEGYIPIFQAARDLKVRLLALNVDSEDLAQVERDGYRGLPKDRLRKYIQDPIGFGAFANEEQFKAYVGYVIGPSYEIHEKLGLLQYTIAGEKLDSPMSFRNFLSGRILWDEGMASAAYSWTKSNPGGLVVGLVGADHVKFRDGIPGRFSRMAGGESKCISVIINPTLIDTRPSGSVSNIPDSDSSQMPDRLTLQLRYLLKGIDPSPENRARPESTGGVLPLSDYIVVTG